MSNEQDTFQNNNISVNVQRKPECLAEFVVTASPEYVKSFYEKAIKNTNKEVSFPGFRKGKVPNAMVLQHFKPQVESEWRNLVMNGVFQEAVTLTNLHPLRRKQNNSVNADIKSISLENGASLLYSFETQPDVPKVIPQDFTMPLVPLKETSEEDVEKAIKEFLTSRAEWKKIEDRPVQLGDFVEIDVDTLGDNPSNVCTNSREHVNPDHMDEWARRAIIGLTPGQTVDALDETFKPEENCKACESGEEHTHQKPMTFRIKLNSISEAVLPELTDEFAKNFGAESVADMKEKISIKQLQNVKDEQRAEIHKQLEQAIVEKYTFDIAPSLVNDQVSAYVNNMFNDPKLKDTPRDQIEEWAKNNIADLKEKAIKMLRTHLLFRRAAFDLGIQISEEEVNASWQFRTYMQNLFNPNQEPISKDTIFEELLKHRVLDTILKSINASSQGLEI